MKMRQLAKIFGDICCYRCLEENGEVDSFMIHTEKFCGQGHVGAFPIACGDTWQYSHDTAKMRKLDDNMLLALSIRFPPIDGEPSTQSLRHKQVAAFLIDYLKRRDK